MAEKALNPPEEDYVPGLLRCNFLGGEIWRFNSGQAKHSLFLSRDVNNHAKLIGKNKKLSWFYNSSDLDSQNDCSEVTVSIISKSIKLCPYLWIPYLSSLFDLFSKSNVNLKDRGLELEEYPSFFDALSKEGVNLFVMGVNSIFVWIFEHCGERLNYNNDNFLSRVHFASVLEKREEGFSWRAMLFDDLVLSEGIILEDISNITHEQKQILDKLCSDCNCILDVVRCIELDKHSLKRLGGNLMLLTSFAKKIGIKHQGVEIAAGVCKMMAIGIDEFGVIVNDDVGDKSLLVNDLYAELGIIPNWKEARCYQKRPEVINTCEPQGSSSEESEYYECEIKRLRNRGISWSDVKWCNLSEDIRDKMTKKCKIEIVEDSAMMCQSENKGVRSFLLDLASYDLMPFHEFESIKKLYEEIGRLSGTCNKLPNYQLESIIRKLISIFIAYGREGIYLDNPKTLVIVKLLYIIYYIYKSKQFGISNALHLDGSLELEELLSIVDQGFSIPEESSIKGLSKHDFLNSKIWRFDREEEYPQFIIYTARNHLRSVDENARLNWYCDDSRNQCLEIVSVIPQSIVRYPYLWIPYLSYLFFECDVSFKDRGLEEDYNSYRLFLPKFDPYYKGMNSMSVWIVENCEGRLHYHNYFNRRLCNIGLLGRYKKLFSWRAMFFTDLVLSKGIFCGEVNNLVPEDDEMFYELCSDCNCVLNVLCFIRLNAHNLRRLRDNLMSIISYIKISYALSMEEACSEIAEMSDEMQKKLIVDFQGIGVIKGIEVACAVCEIMALSIGEFEVVINECELGSRDLCRIINGLYVKLGIIPDWEEAKIIFDPAYFERRSHFESQKPCSEKSYLESCECEIVRLHSQKIFWSNLKWSHLEEDILDKMVKGYELRVAKQSADDSTMAPEYFVDDSALMCKCKHKEVRNFVLSLAFHGLKSFYEFDSIEELYTNKNKVSSLCNMLLGYQLKVVIQEYISVFVIFIKEGLIGNAQMQVMVELFYVFYCIYKGKQLNISCPLYLGVDQQSDGLLGTLSSLKVSSLVLEESNRELQDTCNKLTSELESNSARVVDLEEKMKNLLSVLQSSGVLGNAQAGHLFSMKNKSERGK